jgi:hypothetical protein
LLLSILLHVSVVINSSHVLDNMCDSEMSWHKEMDSIKKDSRVMPFFKLTFDFFRSEKRKGKVCKRERE